MKKPRYDIRLLVIVVAWTLATLPLLLSANAHLWFVNARHGCFPWSPAVVEYHDNMTICPGQSAVLRIPITVTVAPAREGI